MTPVAQAIMLRPLPIGLPIIGGFLLTYATIAHRLAERSDRRRTRAAREIERLSVHPDAPLPRRPLPDLTCSRRPPLRGLLLPAALCFTPSLTCYVELMILFYNRGTKRSGVY